MPYFGPTGAVAGGLSGPSTAGGGGGGGGFSNFLAALLSQSGMNTNVPPQARTLSQSTQDAVHSAASESGNPLARAARALFAMAQANGMNVNAANYGTSGAFGPGGPGAFYPYGRERFAPNTIEEEEGAQAQVEAEPAYSDNLQSSNLLSKAAMGASGGQQPDPNMLMQLLLSLIQGQGRGQGQTPGYGSYA